MRLRKYQSSIKVSPDTELVQHVILKIKNTLYPLAQIHPEQLISLREGGVDRKIHSHGLPFYWAFLNKKILLWPLPANGMECIIESLARKRR